MARLFTLTETILKDWFVEFNNKYFDGELHMPKFKINTAKTFLGQFCQYTATSNCRPVIKMSVYLDRNEHDFRNTFLHEMVHLWQHQNHFHDCHGASFKRKAKELNKFGWEIQRCSNTHGAKRAEGIVKKSRTRDNNVYLFVWENECGSKKWCMVQKCGLSKCIASAYGNPTKYKNLKIYYITQLLGFTSNTKDLRYYDFEKYKNLLYPLMNSQNERTQQLAFVYR